MGGLEGRAFRRAMLIAIAVILLLAQVLIVLLVAKAFRYTPTPDTDIPFEVNTDFSDETTVEYVRDVKNIKYNFLAVGVDRAAGLGDAILLISLDADTGGVTVMQIPRDTYVEIEDGSVRINSLLRDYGVQKIVSVLESALCVNIDYYAVIDLDAFGAAVDAVGGVMIDVPFDMKYSDPYQDLYIDLKAGLQLLDGDGAQDFVRYRSGYADGDLGRVDAQKQFMSAFLAKIKSDLTIPAAISLAGELIPMVETDVTIDDCVYFATALLSGDGGLTMFTAPGRQLESSGSWYYVISRVGTMDAVNMYFNVYDREITNAVFDSNTVFCRDDDDFLRIYYYSLIDHNPVEG